LVPRSAWVGHVEAEIKLTEIAPQVPAADVVVVARDAKLHDRKVILD